MYTIKKVILILVIFIYIFLGGKRLKFRDRLSVEPANGLKYSHCETYYRCDIEALVRNIPTDDAVKTHMMSTAELDPIAILRTNSGEKIIAGVDRARAAYELWSPMRVCIYI